MRWSRALVAALFILVIAACSSPAADDPDGNPDDGEIFSTTNAQEGTNWLFAESDASDFGGSVSVAPNTNGDGTAVIVTITGE